MGSLNQGGARDLLNVYSCRSVCVWVFVREGMYDCWRLATGLLHFRACLSVRIFVYVCMCVCVWYGLGRSGVPGKCAFMRVHLCFYNLEKVCVCVCLCINSSGVVRLLRCVTEMYMWVWGHWERCVFRCVKISVCEWNNHWGVLLHVAEQWDTAGDPAGENAWKDKEVCIPLSPIFLLSYPLLSFPSHIMFGTNT